MTKRLTVLLMLVSMLAVGQGRLGVQRYGHVVLPVKTLATSLAFYSNVLGLKSVAVPGSLASSQAWFDIGNGQQIRLVEGRPEAGNSRSPTASVGLVVVSLRQAEQQLRQRGAAVSRQSATTGGQSVLLLTDPDGYVLELIEGKADSPGFLQSTAKSIWRSMTDVD